MSPQHRTRGIVLAGAAIFLVPAFAQSTSGAGTTSDGSNKGGPPTPDLSINSTGSGQNRTLQPIRVSGRVMINDGSKLSTPAAVERICSGTAHTEGFTDIEGYFSIALGQGAGVTGEAAEDDAGGVNPGVPARPATGNVGTAGTGSTRYMGPNNRYANCDLRARLAGYVSKSLSLADRGPLDNPDVGIILIHRLGESEKSDTVTATTLKAPKEARKALQKGQDLAKKNKVDEAIASLREAVRLDPQFAAAWLELGKLSGRAGHADEAREAFAAAANAEPRWPEPYMRLAVMSAEAHNWKEVAENADQVLRLNSFEFPEAYFLNAVANYNLQHLALAEKSAALAEKLDTQHQLPQIAHLLGTIFAEQHRYAEAADKFRTYLLLAPNASDAPAARQRLAEMEKLSAQSELAGKDHQ